jgi:hypothetical protein
MSGQAFVFLKRERDKHDVRDRHSQKAEGRTVRDFNLQPSQL